jgi:Fe-S cluster assembly protein SufD
MNEILFKDGKPSFKTSELLYEKSTLTIPKNYQNKEPIKITIVDQKLSTLDIIVKESAEATIIVELNTIFDLEHTYHITLNAHPNSHVKYLLITELKGMKANVFQKFIAHRDSTLDLIGGFVSNKMNMNLSVDLIEEGSNAKIRVVAVSSEDHDQVINVNFKHNAKNTFGDMTNIGIANKNGRIILNGVEKIEKGMKNANAFQTLKGIIMSDEARVEVNPILLIDEFDVKAGHGATIGKVEEEQLYYIQSRGLTKAEAEKLIINGFLKPVIDEISDDTLRTRFTEIVNSRI